VLFVGDDWAEEHHDLCLMDEAGTVLARQRVADSAEGARQLHALIADHASTPADVVVGVETDRGLVVSTLLAAGYQVYAINPLAVSNYRQRHTLSRAKSDAADAKLLADLVRTDRHNHRPVAGDSDQATAVKVLARGHQRLIWTRQRQVNQLRSALRDFYPAALLAFDSDLASNDALAVLSTAPTPAQGQALSKRQLVGVLRRGGRQRNLESRAADLVLTLRTSQLALPAVLAQAYGATVQATVLVIAELNRQIADLERQLTVSFKSHPDAEIILSLPGLGAVLGARVLAEFGDDPTRYVDSRARKNFAGSSPITIASGKSRSVQARFPRNTRLAAAGFLWAMTASNASPGARCYYDALRARKQTHAQASRALANRLFGILHGCLHHRTLYSETIAWAHLTSCAA
jgi:transposase